MAPDDVVYAVGGGSSGARALWEYDPATGGISNVGTPDPKVTLARAVAATRTHAFFGAGTTFNGGGDTSRAALYAYDRSAGTFTSIAPPEMLRDPSIRDLAVLGDRLAVSTAGSTEDAKVALMDLKDLSSYRIATSIGKVAKSFTMIGDTVHYANESGLLAYLPSANTVTPVAYDGPELGEIWGVDSRAGMAVVTSAFGFVAETDPARRTAAFIDLGSAGAPMAPQTAMGIAAGGGHVYVGGNATNVPNERDGPSGAGGSAVAWLGAGVRGLPCRNDTRGGLFRRLRLFRRGPGGEGSPSSSLMCCIAHSARYTLSMRWSGPALPGRGCAGSTGCEWMLGATARR